MKAVDRSEYDDTDVLRLMRLERPVPQKALRRAFAEFTLCP